MLVDHVEANLKSAIHVNAAALDQAIFLKALTQQMVGRYVARVIP